MFKLESLTADKHKIQDTDIINEVFRSETRLFRC